MQYIKDKLTSVSVTRKVFIGFSLAFMAILLALWIAHFAFRDVMDTVDNLSAPNEKLTVLNKVFQEITTLDQLQRAEALKDPRKPYHAFLNQSQSLLNMIDSLTAMPWDSAQLIRISSMKDVLKKRDKLFFSYLKQKSVLVSNASLSKRIDTLSTIINQKKLEIDTSVVTTQKKTITTYLRDSTEKEKKDDRFFITRLFSKKKSESETSKEPQIKVQEELSISIDTLAIAKQNRALEEVEKIMYDLEADQRTQNQKLVRQELDLIHANTLFFTDLLGILHEVETEEMNKMRAENDHAATLMNQSISRISLLLLFFLLGGALVVYLIWIDITKSNYYKEQLEKARDEAEQLSQIKQRFLANMSHEIRTPLQSIIGFAEQIRQKPSADSEAVDAIYSSSEHLLHIVNEVLDYSRISSGRFNMEKENFRLMGIIREVESAIRIQAEKKRLTLLVDLDEASDHMLLGDSFRLRQILYNLLGNAVKFTHKGYVKLHVKTIPNLNSVRCIFEITDTGIGIQPEDLDKIFNQFEQANASISRQYGGTGLGLTIVKSLVEALDGELTAASTPGQGSTFTAEMVFVKAPVSHQPKTKTHNGIAAGAFEGKVIVVDDDAMILKLCGLILDKYNVEKILYSEPEKLLQQKSDPDVTHILMDIRMPHINGVELCRALKKIYDRPVTYVALTAHVLPEEQRELIDQGFNTVLSKPFREEDLVRLLGIQPRQAGDAIEQTPAIIDVSLLKSMTLGDEQLFQSIINQFVHDTGQDLVLLQERLDTADAPGVREIVHKLTGRIGQIGGKPLSEKFGRIERRIDKGEELLSMTEEIETLIAETDRAVLSLREMLVPQNA